MTRRALRPLSAAAAAILIGVSAGCSVPTLEDPRCAEAQDSVNRFYSLHFGRNEAEAELSQAERPFLSDRLASDLASRQASEADYFTAGTRFPKAFRVGSCTLRPDQSADVDVLLLWRDEEKSEQQHVRVNAARAAGSWVIDTVSPL